MSSFTYANKAESDADRNHLKTFLDAISGAKSSLKLDPCRCWVVEGSRGSLYTWGDSETWLLVVSDDEGLVESGKRSAKKWNNLRRKLLEIPGTFCTRDGDEGGCIRFTQLPSDPRHAETIRKAIGLRQTVKGSNNLPPKQIPALRNPPLEPIFCQEEEVGARAMPETV